MRSYFPQNTNIKKFARVQAEDLNEELLLSVHQEISFKRKIKGTIGFEKKSFKDIDLFNEFLTPSEEITITPGFKLMIITGDTGVGKSHYVRWLNAKLTKDIRSNNMHLVWVKKYDGVRDVLYKLLSDFENNSEINDLKIQISQSIDDIDSSDYGEKLRFGLNVALERYKNELDEEFKGVDNEILLSLDEKKSKKNELKKLKHHAGTDGIRTLWNDPTISSIYINDIFPRFLQRAMGGLEDEIVDNRFQEFSKKDLFEAFENKDFKVDNFAANTRNYYNYINGDNVKIKTALECMNHILNNAVSSALQIEGMQVRGQSFQDIFNKIRILLKNNQKELVFLIEDYAALTGIKESLKKMFIQGDLEKFCMIRSLVAVTEDFVYKENTLETRADTFFIDKEPDDHSNIIRRTENMLGSYLNAMRYEEDDLSNQIDKISSGSENSIDKYINPSLTLHDEELINAFGSCEKEFSLFPYNNHVIQKFVDIYFKKGDQYFFNARQVIINMIEGRLKDSYEDFINEKFPLNFHDGSGISAAYDNQIDKKSLNVDQKQKYKNIIYYWGNGKNNFSGSEKIFEAFKIPKLKIQDDRSVFEIEIETVPGNSIRSPDKPTAIFKSTKYIANLKKWFEKGLELENTTANLIRNSLVKLVNDNILWADYNVKKENLLPMQIYIENATGQKNSTEKRRIKINKNSINQLFLVSMLKIHHLEASSSDYIKFYNFIPNIINEHINYLIHDQGKEVSNITHLLIKQSKILGVYNKNKKYENIFFTIPDQIKTFEFYKENNELTSLNININDIENCFQKYNMIIEKTLKIAPKLQAELKDLIGMKQGDNRGEISAVKFVAIDKVLKEGVTFNEASNIKTLHVTEYNDYRSIILDNKKLGYFYSKYKDDVNQLIIKIKDNFNDNFTIDKLETSFFKLLELIHKNGIPGPNLANYCNALINELRNIKFKLLTQEITHQNGDEMIVEEIGKLNLVSIFLINQLFINVNNIIFQIEQELTKSQLPEVVNLKELQTVVSSNITSISLSLSQIREIEL